MTDYTFHPVYVEPYYLLLTNANFVIQGEKAHDLFTRLLRIEKELGNFQLQQMLRSSWRPAKVAAWIIGLARKTELEGDLIRAIQSNPGYCEHLIFALTFLNTGDSIKAIEHHIYSQTDQVRRSFDLYKIETLCFDWALAALDWLDAHNGTTGTKKIIQAWELFKKDMAVYEEKYRFSIERCVPIKERKEDFDIAMRLAKSHI